MGIDLNRSEVDCESGAEVEVGGTFEDAVTVLAPVRLPWVVAMRGIARSCVEGKEANSAQSFNPTLVSRDFEPAGQSPSAHFIFKNVDTTAPSITLMVRWVMRAAS